MKIVLKQKFPFYIAIGTFFLALIIAGCAPGKKPFGYHLLRINGKFVDAHIIKEEWARFYEQHRRDAGMHRKPLEEVNHIFINTVIERVLTELYISNRKDIVVSQEEVSNYIDKYVKPSYYAMLDEHSPIPESYKDIQIPPSKFEDTRSFLQRLRILPEIARKYGISVSTEEINKEYEKQKMANVLVIGRILVTSNQPSKFVDEIEGKIKSGTNFAELCRDYSLDQETKYSGGLVGNLRNLHLIPHLENNLDKIKKGELLRINPDKKSITFILIEDIVPFYHPKEEIEQILLLQKFATSDAFKQWIGELKNSNKVEIMDPLYKVFQVYQDGKYAEAGKLYEEIYQKNKTAPHFLSQGIECYKKASNWKRVIQLCSENENRFPGLRLDYYLIKAEAFFRLNKTNEALAFLKKAEKEAGNNSLNIGRVAEAYFGLGFTNEGIALTNSIH